MNKSVLTYIVLVLLLIVVGIAVWRLSSSSSPAQTTAQTGTSAVSTSSAPTTAAASTSAAIPGDNLTLGQDSNAAVGNYLVGYNGMTLYTYSPDTTGVSNCTGSCAATWPPYIVTSTNNLVAESPISGKVDTLTRADGSLQVTYNGRPLYFYAKDTASGDANGQGVGGVWFVARP